MSGQSGGAGRGPANLGSMEERLGAILLRTADEVAHSECFDCEQRAEVYTILETLKANTETHRAMVKLLNRRIRERQGNA